jgi:hypothetical protein
VKPFSLTRETLSPPLLEGRVLARDLRDAAGRIAFRKGRVLKPADVAELERLDWAALHLIEVEPGDLHEEEAGSRLAHAVAGEGIAVGELAGGAWPLRSRWRGIFSVEVDALRRVNTADAISVYTLFSGQIVDEGETVARAKIIPLVTQESVLEGAERAARQSAGLLRVRPFFPARVGAAVQDTLTPRQSTRFHEVLGEKVQWFGSELIEPIHAGATDAELSAALDRLVADGADLVVLAGTKAMDPLDPAFTALERLGVALERHGVPAHPGSLFWIARLRGIPILGMPNCGLFSKATVFDLVLPRILAGEPVGSAELAELGHGGFLTRDLAFRFPPYRPLAGRGEVLPDE